MSGDRSADQGPTLERRTVLKSVGIAGLAGAGLGQVSGLGGPGDASTLAAADPPTGDDAPTVRGSVRQVKVWDMVPGATVRLYGPDGSIVDEVQSRFPDDPLEWFQGASYVFREVEPASGYQVSQVVDGEESPLSGSIEVLTEEYVPPQSFYDGQDIDETPGEEIGYVEMRDGTTLAHQTIFPPAEIADPPYPTLVIYSGYAPSVNLPGDELVIDTIVNELGYALVAVNKRGTQCSGGKFDFFETLQILDTYDIIEAVGAQDWNDGIGMVGGSYSGYSQFYVAVAQPPSLDAISPGMPVGDFYRDVGYPGGMLNTTFGAAWAGSRDGSARHDTDGRGDTTDRVLDDDRCMENQSLRPNNEPTLGRLQGNPYYEVDFYLDRTPWELADQIEVPTFLNVSWQDEQVGSRCARLVEQFPDDTTVRMMHGNGDHDIYLAPDVVEELLRFNAYYVKKEIPEADAEEFDSFEDARAAYEAEDPVTILWEMDQDQTPGGRTTHEAWPPAGETWELYCQPDGSLAGEPPTTVETSFSTYRFESPGFGLQPIARDEEGRLVWDEDPETEYTAFVSGELATDQVCLGSGLVELWVASTAANTDLQVTLSEVRPDGTEMFVQNGWLRTSHRAEDDARARPRRPWHTHAEADQQPLPESGFAEMRVEIHPFGHVFREGSRVKLAIDNPGGTRNLWGFELVEDTATNAVAHTEAMPSKLELPLLEDSIPAVSEHPDCGTVRNQPCRPVDVEAIQDRDEPTAVIAVDAVDLSAETVDRGEAVDVSATLRSVVGDSDTVVAELLVGEEMAGSASTDLDPGEIETLTFSLDTADLEPGADELTVRSGQDAGTAGVTVQEDPPDNGDDEDTADDTTDPDTDEDADDDGPGFGIPAAVTSLGAAGYLLRRRVRTNGSEADE